MKTIYAILFAAGTLLFSSCNEWLSVEIPDTVTEEDLFKEGSGYRNALNGIYRELASSSLYGKELTWGMAEILAKTYYSSQFLGHAYADMLNYNYETVRSEDLIESIWEKAFNAIANCNNLIVRLAEEPGSKFKGGELERDMILGEAYALRGWLHFEMLCYFAPAPATSPTGAWIPYYESFPSTGAPYQSVEATLERVIRDLKRGQELVEPFDTYASDTENHRLWLGTGGRFGNTDGSSNSNSSDVFYAYRGYRLTYPAITALLARAYGYADQYELADAEAQKVIGFYIDEYYPGYYTYAYEFTRSWDVTTDYKMTKDLIFALSNQTLVDDYYSFSTDANTRISLNSSIYPAIFDVNGSTSSDYRKTFYKTESRRYIPYKFRALTTGGSDTDDIIPIVRLSEMYYLRAEYYASMGNYPDATAMLEEVRKGAIAVRDSFRGSSPTTPRSASSFSTRCAASSTARAVRSSTTRSTTRSSSAR